MINRKHLLAVLLCTIALPCSAETKPLNEVRPQYAIAVHGGAGGWENLSPQDLRAIRTGMETALRSGRDLLAKGGSSLDAVERVLQTLEDCPSFNAGKGAVYNAAGKHQLDASIMDGRDRSAGAVAAIGVAKNPIAVARLVMTKTQHVLLAGEGANEFARQQGALVVDPNYFWTDQMRKQWKTSQQSSGAAVPSDHYGTVGCVALDLQGNLAAGTSTGGLSEKMLGRVGDSPLIAAGTFADNKTCAVSCTGVGELFIRNAIAYDISARVQYAHESLSEAVAHHIDDRLPKGTGGIISVNRAGELVLKFNTRAMPRGIATSNGRFEVLLEKD